MGEAPRQIPSNRSAQIRKLSPTWQTYAPTDHVSSGSLSDPSASASASLSLPLNSIFRIFGPSRDVDVVSVQIPPISPWPTIRLEHVIHIRVRSGNVLWTVRCAGINRHEAGNERFLRERSSEPSRPRVLRSV